MASGDPPNLTKHMTYSKSRVPIIGALIDYITTSLHYILHKNFDQAEKLNARLSRSSLSPSFLATVCLLLGFTCNVKFEVVTFDEKPLPNDLHFMLLSKDDNIYIDDIDVSRVLLCIEASDFLVLCISCLLIWNSAYVRSPLSEYLFLPWLGVALRGMFLRQAPTACALLYTMAVINGTVDPLFMTAFCFLCLLEVRLWLEIARVVRSRWEHRQLMSPANCVYELETLWSNDDVQSVEVQNYVY